jgi:hemoglobin-like flavoprotein
MKNSHIAIIKDSWNHLAINSPDAGEHFYSILFELAPGVRPLFKPDLKDQSRKLVTMLTFVISKLNSLDEIEAQIKGLARRHANYGAQPEHYPVVGQALLGMLEIELGDHWNDETRQAWIEVYTVLSEAMIDAANAPVTH